MYKIAKVHVRLPHTTILELEGTRFTVQKEDIHSDSGLLFLKDTAQIKHVFPKHAPPHPLSFTGTHEDVRVPNALREKVFA